MRFGRIFVATTALVLLSITPGAAQTAATCLQLAAAAVQATLRSSVADSLYQQKQQTATAAKAKADAAESAYNACRQQSNNTSPCSAEKAGWDSAASVYQAAQAAADQGLADGQSASIDKSNAEQARDDCWAKLAALPPPPPPPPPAGTPVGPPPLPPALSGGGLQCFYSDGTQNWSFTTYDPTITECPTIPIGHNPTGDGIQTPPPPGVPFDKRVKGCSYLTDGTLDPNSGPGCPLTNNNTSTAITDGGVPGCSYLADNTLDPNSDPNCPWWNPYPNPLPPITIAGTDPGGPPPGNPDPPVLPPVNLCDPTFAMRVDAYRADMYRPVRPVAPVTPLPPAVAKTRVLDPAPLPPRGGPPNISAATIPASPLGGGPALPPVVIGAVPAVPLGVGGGVGSGWNAGPLPSPGNGGGGGGMGLLPPPNLCHPRTGGGTATAMPLGPRSSAPAGGGNLGMQPNPCHSKPPSSGGGNMRTANLTPAGTPTGGSSARSGPQHGQPTGGFRRGKPGAAGHPRAGGGGHTIGTLRGASSGTHGGTTIHRTNAGSHNPGFSRAGRSGSGFRMAHGGGFHGGGGGVRMASSGFRGGGGGFHTGGGGGFHMGGGGGFHTGGGGGFHMGGGGHHFSDLRLKEAIVPLDRLDSGIGLYRFRYKGGDSTTYVGVMAQEVQKVVPEAVSRGRDGFLRVNYTRLGIAFMTWREWLARGNAQPQASP